MAYGFQIYGTDGSLQFDVNSIALMLHDSFEVTGTNSFNKSFTWDEDVTTAFLVIEDYLYNNVDFIFNSQVGHGATITYNNTTRTVSLVGNPVYLNVGKTLSNFSTYVSGSKLRYLIYVA